MTAKGTKAKANRADQVRTAFKEIIDLAPPAASDESIATTDERWRRICRDMASRARLALHNLEKGNPNV